MAVTPVNSTKTVTTAGTRVQINTDTAILPSSIYIEALGTNTGFIYVGLSDVSSTVYITRLSSGQGIHLSADAVGRLGSVGLQLSALWLDSSVSGEKAQVTYMYPTGG